MTARQAFLYLSVALVAIIMEMWKWGQTPISGSNGNGDRPQFPEVVVSYERIYPCIADGCLLDDAAVPEDWKPDWEAANAASWRAGGSVHASYPHRL